MLAPRIFVAAALLAAACQKQEASPAAPAPLATPAPTAAAPTEPPAPPPIPPRTGTPLDDVLDSYEQLRARLAGDDFPDAKTAAEKVVASSGAASQPGSATEAQVKAIQEAAQKIQGAADMPAARLAFGELSKSTIALLVAKPELQTGRFLFMCPMAKGYQKWVQTDQKLRNPYWGKEMLECGEELKQWAS